MLKTKSIYHTETLLLQARLDFLRRTLGSYAPDEHQWVAFRDGAEDHFQVLAGLGDLYSMLETNQQHRHTSLMRCLATAYGIDQEEVDQFLSDDEDDDDEFYDDEDDDDENDDEDEKQRETGNG